MTSSGSTRVSGSGSVPRSPTAAPPLARLPLLAICLGFFLVILDATVVTVVVPRITDQLGGSATARQWIVDGYTLVFAGMLPLCGGLGDRLGHRRLFHVGLSVFTAASAGCALAPTADALVGLRLVQGVGAATMVPASLALLDAVHRDPAARARAFGVWGGVSGVGAAAGPVVGGLLAWGVGWRAVFLINVPLGLLAVVLTRRHVPAAPGGSPGGAHATPPAAGSPGHGRRWRPRGLSALDLPAQCAAVAAIAAVTAGLNEAGARGWKDPLVLGCLAAAPVAGLLFALLERVSAAPALPPRLLADIRFPARLAVGALLNLGFYGLLFVATVYLQQHRGWDPLRTGLGLLPAMTLVAVGSPLSGRVAARTGTRVPAVCGLLIGAVGLVGWSVVGAHTPYPLLLVPLLLAAFGTAFTMPSATVAAMETAPAEVRGAASGAFNAARQLGSAIGVALFGTLVASARGFYPGMHLSALIGGACFATAAALAAVP